MKRITYQVFLISGEKVIQFESMWQFQVEEQLFLSGDSEKRNFIITRITHDINATDGHVVRLYCQEKKVY